MAYYAAELEEVDYYMMDYYPYKSGLQDTDSQTLVYLKMGQVYDDGRKYEFINRIQKWLVKCVKKIRAKHPGRKIIFGIAPGHSPSSSNSFMITELDIDSLFDDPRVSFHPKLLKRFVEVPKQATGGIRSIDIHLNSIQVAEDIDVTDKIVCIMDDVWTTGCTLNACMQLVEQKGTKQVYTLAIGKTVKMQEQNDF